MARPQKHTPRDIFWAAQQFETQMAFKKAHPGMYAAAKRIQKQDSDGEDWFEQLTAHMKKGVGRPSTHGWDVIEDAARKCVELERFKFIHPSLFAAAVRLGRREELLQLFSEMNEGSPGLEDAAQYLQWRSGLTPAEWDSFMATDIDENTDRAALPDVQTCQSILQGHASLRFHRREHEGVVAGASFDEIEIVAAAESALLVLGAGGGITFDLCEAAGLDTQRVVAAYYGDFNNWEALSADEFTALRDACEPTNIECPVRYNLHTFAEACLRDRKD